MARHKFALLEGKEQTLALFAPAAPQIATAAYCREDLSSDRRLAQLRTASK
jgi:hypothetical protein